MKHIRGTAKFTVVVLQGTCDVMTAMKSLHLGHKPQGIKEETNLIKLSDVKPKQ
jgi:hypothetical protein